MVISVIDMLRSIQSKSRTVTCVEKQRLNQYD